LDALGTLVTMEPPAPNLRAELARRFGIEVSEAQAHQAVMAEIAYYRAHFDEGRDDDSLAALRRRCAGALRAALPASEPLARVDDDAMTATLLASLRFHAFDDVQPAVAAARAAGLRVVVVSNWDVSLVRVLAQLELAPLMDAILTSAQVGSRKPSAEIFRRALAIAGVAAHEAVHVGDSLDDDVEGARGVGIEPVLMRRDGAAGPADVLTIARLTELSWIRGSSA
jgi:putative hydrolase of the HAD superfamily